MLSLLKITLIDADLNRRNRICDALFDKGVLGEPKSDMDSLMLHKQMIELLLVADQDELLEEVMLENDAAKHRLPIITYCKVPRTQRVLKMARAGVAGYLAWPTTGLMMRTALETASSSSLMGSKAGKKASANLIEKFSGQHSEAIGFLIEHQTKKKIEDELAISGATFDAHRANMMRETDVKEDSNGEPILLKRSTH